MYSVHPCMLYIIFLSFTITQFLNILCCYDCTQNTFDINSLDLKFEIRVIINIAKEVNYENIK